MATAVAYDVMAIHPDQTEKTDAIAIELEHRMGQNPITMLVHYKVEGDEVKTLEPYGAPKEKEMFQGHMIDSDFMPVEEQSTNAPEVDTASKAEDDDEGLSPEERATWLRSLPTMCFLLVSGIDGDIDKKETLAFSKAVESYSQHSNPLIQSVFSEAMEHIADDMKELTSLGEAAVMMLPLRMAVCRQTALEKDPQNAPEFFEALIKMSTDIAAASGGFLGFGSKISKEEKVALELIESMLTSESKD